MEWKFPEINSPSRFPVIASPKPKIITCISPAALIMNDVRMACLLRYYAPRGCCCNEDTMQKVLVLARSRRGIVDCGLDKEWRAILPELPILHEVQARIASCNHLLYVWTSKKISECHDCLEFRLLTFSKYLSAQICCRTRCIGGS